MLATDVLSKSTPTRLICHGGRWTLELSRLEAVDRDVFQPRLTRLEGTDSILAALRRSDEGQQLVASTVQLMRGPRSDDDRAFEVSDGDWVPSAESSLPARRETARDTLDAVDVSRALAELRAELSVLRASHSRLRDRVVALEASQSGIAHPNLRPLRAGRSQRHRSEPPEGFTKAQVAPEALANNPGFAATQASPGLRAGAPAAGHLAPSAPGLSPGSPAATKEQEAPASVEESAEESAQEPPGEPLPAVLGLPTVASITECLAMLMGSAPHLERVAEVPFGRYERMQLCKLLDDEGLERGAIVLDLKAAVLLGAGLLALPRDEALRQLRENEPSEDALLATSEICNNLTGPINTVSGNAHVRSTALMALEAADVSALPKPRSRLDLLVDGGRLTLAMF